MVAVPSSTTKPCSRNSFTYQAADRYSRHAGSWKFHTSVWRSESQAACALIQSKAVSLAGVSAAGPQSRVAAEWSFGMKGLQGIQDGKDAGALRRRRRAPEASRG